MENIILHSTPLKEFRDIIGDIVTERLQQFKPAEPPQTNSNAEYLTRAEVCDLLRISLSTLHYYTKRDGILKGYRIGGRILYKSAEVQGAIHDIQSLKYKRA
ncbi:MAG: helix-turn-helix domain-containing protein [Bacteroidetes bacterium]|nr:helix-turn-helix domain-containing protein [Bacteroidota bacterium]